MKITYKNLLLLFFFIIFILLFRYNTLVKETVISSTSLWFYNLVPSMFIMYLITDLLINYGLANILYKIFKSNSPIIIGISLLLGTPANAKYIKEFYNGGYIDKSEASRLLMYAYSPNPLFILGIAPTKSLALLTLGTIYLSNLIMYLFTRRKKTNTLNKKTFECIPFSKCLENSIHKSFNILILVLGVVITYGVFNAILDKFLVGDNIILKSILEMTNAMKSIVQDKKYYKYMLLAASFGGFSIHTQVKSILESTDLPYKNFLIGRIVSSSIAIIMMMFIH